MRSPICQQIQQLLQRLFQYHSLQQNSVSCGRYSLKKVIINTILFLSSICLLILSLLFRNVILLVCGLWLLIQIFVFNFQCLSSLSKLIISAASTFSIAVFFLLSVVYDIKLVSLLHSSFTIAIEPMCVQGSPQSISPSQPSTAKEWTVYIGPCGNPVRCCAKEMKVVHECLWNAENPICHNSAVAYWMCLVANGMPRDEHNIFVQAKHGRSVHA